MAQRIASAIGRCVSRLVRVREQRKFEIKLNHAVMKTISLQKEKSPLTPHPAREAVFCRLHRQQWRGEELFPGIPGMAQTEKLSHHRPYTPPNRKSRR